MKSPPGLFPALLSLSLTAFAVAQTAPQPALPPESRQFDFWVGDWEVTTPDGKPAGTNKIEPVSNGAGLLENWQGDGQTGGGSGKSLNTYNAGKKQWQQFWVGSGGGVLELAGGMVDGRMVLKGEHEVRGQRTLERITWTPGADGSVRQLWDQSTDGGKTWQVVFDGTYRRKK